MFFCHFRCEWVVAISKMYLRHYLISTTFSHHRPPPGKSPCVLEQDHADFYGLLTWIISEKSFLLCLCLLVVPVKGSSLVMEAMLVSFCWWLRNGYAVLGKQAPAVLLVPCLWHHGAPLPAHCSSTPVCSLTLGCSESWCEMWFSVLNNWPWLIAQLLLRDLMG